MRKQMTRRPRPAVNGHAPAMDADLLRFNLDAYIRWLSNNNTQGLMAPMYTAPITYSRRGKPTERVENSFSGYVMGGYKSNPIVFGVMKRRSSVFSEARFMWRRLEDGKPGELFYNDDLETLSRPWPNGTTGELLTRMIQDVDLSGNCYLVNEGNRLRRLRPDWVQIVLSGDPLTDPDIDVVGYVFTPGGPDNGTGKAYQVEDVCHWSPVPDPEASYRGMSWLTPVIREIQADQAAVEHKLNFFRQGATLGPIIKVSDKFTPEQFKEFIRANEEAHGGVDNAYKTMYLGGGADVTLAAADFRQMDFSGSQGKAETRICVAGGVPAVIAGVSEGLQGSSLNAGNYNAAKRSFVDGELRSLWRSACASLQGIVEVPDHAELWFDESAIAYLRDDSQDIAAIQQTQMTALSSGITAGFEPPTVVDALVSNDLTKLKHSGLVSVQLNPPGQGTEPPSAQLGGGALPPVPPGFEAQRAYQSQNTGSNTGGQTAHEPAGSPKGGQFTANPSGGGASKGYQSILPPASAYNSGGGRKATSTAPQDVPQPPAEPRTMKPGDSGEDVRYAQYGLSLLGFNVSQSGTYDQQTVDAVKQMQERLGVKKPNGHLTSAQLRQIQTAVRLSPCIGRSDKSLAEDMFDGILRSLDLDDSDEEDDEDAEDLEPYHSAPDDEVDAVLDALGEFVGRSADPEWVERRFNPDELRDPHGRWTRSIGGRIQKLLHEWERGNGDSNTDPFVVDGKEIDREPLRKVAKLRGIELKPGADRDTIVKALLDDVRAEVAGRKADRPNLPGVGPDHRRFTIQLGGKVDKAAVREVEVENKIRAAYREVPKGSVGFAGLADLRERIGPDVPRSEVDAALKKLAREPGVHIAPADMGSTYPWTGVKAPLGSRDRSAALELGDSPKHMIRLTDEAASPRPLPKPSGTATDVGIFAAPSTGKLSLYRESDTGKRTGRAIKSFDDMAGLESWARDNGHTELADYAKAEQARTGAANATPAEAARPKTREELDAEHLAREEKISAQERDPVHLRDRARRLRGQSIAATRAGNEAKSRDLLKSAAELDRRANAIQPMTDAEINDYNRHLMLHVTEAERQRLVRDARTAAAKAEQARTGGAAKVAKAAPAKAAKLAPAKLSADPAVREVEVENRIRAAYEKLRRPDGPQWVALADLRAELGDVPRAEQDQALRRLLSADAPGANRLIPEENQKTLTKADAAAAINLSGEDKHLISIKDPSPRPLPNADPLASLPAGLTTVQKRAALRKRGLSKAEIDALAPLGAKKAAVAPAKSAPPVADSPHVASLKSRLAAIDAEAKPIRDEVLKRRQSTRVYGHNENMDFHRSRVRLKALGEEGSRVARELFDNLAQRDGEPWGGDPATDAARWESVRPSGSFVDRGTVDEATRKKLRDAYVINDQKTLEHNASLRSGNPTPAAKAWAAKASRMVKASELTHDTKLARGAALPPETVIQLRPGAVIHDRGIVSTAETDSSFMSADHYLRDRLENNPGTIPTMFEIRAPKGTPAADVGYGEVVLDRDQRFRIVSSRMGDDGVAHVVMELIGK